MRDRKATPFGSVHSPTRTNAVFSPDGRWVAYASTDQGRKKLFLDPFPPTGVGHQLTPEQASQPLWTPDGKELIYNPRPGLIAITRVSTTPTVTFSTPVELTRPFQTGPPAMRRAFDITPGGQFVGLITSGQTDVRHTRDELTDPRSCSTGWKSSSNAYPGKTVAAMALTGRPPRPL